MAANPSVRVVSSARPILAVSVLLAALTFSGCEKPKPEPAKKTIGHIVTQFGITVGGTWIPGYSVDVVPEEYALVEHVKCPEAKDSRVPKDVARGICVFRISKAQSRAVEAAMEPYKRFAVPLQSVSLEDPWTRPDGKACRHQTTDATLITLTWTGTEGVKLARFYTGCDFEEFESFYKSALAVTDPLPIQQVIGKH